MKTDRELLELAAKAAGIPVKWDEEHECFMRQDAVGTVPWRPLTDDGDALRMAVKLELDVMCASVRTDDFSVQIPIRAGTDIYAATRRAIVRAAAAMGEQA